MNAEDKGKQPFTDGLHDTIATAELKIRKADESLYRSS